MEVDFSKLTRDYRINPLKRGELIPKEDLQYLFIDANLTLKQMSKIINRHPNQIGRQCKENSVFKSKEQHCNSLKKESKDVDVTFKISNVQNLMIQKFDDVILDYKGRLYTWDFYIPSKNLYIMYNVDICHGGQCFDANNIEHWEIIKTWAEKAQSVETNEEKNYYSNLINTWTITDVLRRNTCNHNNINFKEFFTEKQFMDWYNTI